MENQKSIQELRILGKKIEYDIPLYIPPFELKPLPRNVNQIIEEIYEENKQWLEAHQFSTLMNGIPNTVGLLCHICAIDSVRLKVCIMVYLGLFLQDDVVVPSDEGTQILSSITVIFKTIKEIIKLNAPDYSKFKPIYRNMFDCISEIAKNYSLIQRKRLNKIFDFYYIEIEAEKLLVEGVKTQGQVKPILFDLGPGSETFGYRNRALGLVAQLNEYALGIEVSEKQWNDEIFQQFINFCCRSMNLINDVISFRKEVLEIKRLDKFPNFIAYYASQPGFTLQAAVDKVMEIIYQTNSRVIELRHQLNIKYNNEKDFLLFINETANMISLDWIYHIANERYYGKLDHFPPLAGHVIYDREKYVIIPNDGYDHQIGIPYENYLRKIYKYPK